MLFRLEKLLRCDSGLLKRTINRLISIDHKRSIDCPINFVLYFEISREGTIV